MKNATSIPAHPSGDANTERRKRKFYAIIVIVLGIIFGTATALYFYQSTAIVSMNVLGNPHASLVVVTGSTTQTLSALENATFELPSHFNVSILAIPASSYTATDWRIVGAADVSTSGERADLTTGSGGSTIYVSVVLGTNSTS